MMGGRANMRVQVHWPGWHSQYMNTAHVTTVIGSTTDFLYFFTRSQTFDTLQVISEHAQPALGILRGETVDARWQPSQRAMHFILRQV